MTANRWAELRQVGFATLDHASAVRTATDLLGLGPRFRRPAAGRPGPSRLHRPGRPRHLRRGTRPGHARPLRRPLAGPGWRLVGLGAVHSGPVPGRGEGTRRRARRPGRGRDPDHGRMTSSSCTRSTSACCSSSTRSCRGTAGSGTTCPRPGGASRPHHQGRRHPRGRRGRAPPIPRDPVAMAQTWAAIIGIEPPVPTRTARRSRSATGPSGSCPPGAAGPGSSPSTCMPPTGSTGPAGVASCATP